MDGEVIGSCFIIEEIVLNDITPIAGTDDELAQTAGGKNLHQMPENGPSADFYHWLGLVLGLFPHAGTEATCQQYNLHNKRIVDAGYSCQK